MRNFLYKIVYEFSFENIFSTLHCLSNETPKNMLICILTYYKFCHDFGLKKSMQSAILSADAKIYCISFNIDNLYKGSWIGKLFFLACSIGTLEIQERMPKYLKKTGMF